MKIDVLSVPSVLMRSNDNVYSKYTLEDNVYLVYIVSSKVCKNKSTKKVERRERERRRRYIIFII